MLALFFKISAAFPSCNLGSGTHSWCFSNMLVLIILQRFEKCECHYDTNGTAASFIQARSLRLFPLLWLGPLPLSPSPTGTPTHHFTPMGLASNSVCVARHILMLRCIHVWIVCTQTSIPSSAFTISRLYLWLTMISSLKALSWREKWQLWIKGQRKSITRSNEWI